jgi:hypothetical protein
MTTIRLNQHGLLDHQSLPIGLDRFEDVLDGQVEKLSSILNLLRASAARIKEDRELMPSGKVSRIQRLADDAREAVNKVGVPPGIIDALEKVEEKLPSKIPTPKEPADPTKQNPLSIETRVRLALDQLVRNRQGDPLGDPLAARTLLLNASEMADPHALLALQAAPRWIVAVDEKLVAEAVDVYWKHAEPEHWRQRRDLRALTEYLSGNVVQALKEIDRIAGPDTSVKPVPITA